MRGNKLSPHYTRQCDASVLYFDQCLAQRINFNLRLAVARVMLNWDGATIYKRINGRITVHAGDELESCLENFGNARPGLSFTLRQLFHARIITHTGEGVLKAS